MCDHCSKVTGQKGYAGQVTCKCEHGEKKEEKKEEMGGCCARKEKPATSGCCMSSCCKEKPKEVQNKPTGCCGGHK